MRQFDSIKQVIEARPYEPLDHRNPQFEKDFANFMRQMGELEATLREFIDRSFAEAPTTSHALELLSAFSGALERESMRDGYDEKVLHILCGFEAELDLGFADGRKRAWLYEQNVVQEEAQTETGQHLRVLWTPVQEARFRQL